jgi:ABC-type polysaccharide/polyol phosphate transport system ATPase subunit
MASVALRMDHVSKKFRRGEIHDSLRDLIPALTGRFLRGSSELEKQEFWALDDVCFEVERGEAFGIIGPNGAGKSTILKLLSGILVPTRGQLSVNGSLSALIEVGAGFHPDLTGRENIYLNGSILGMKRQEIAAKFDEIVEFSGLAEFLDTPVKRYSSGMYARLGFSVAAHVDPDVLVVDEVLSVGDLVFQRKCLQRMGEVLNSGATVVFVSHSLRAVAELCSRSMLLIGGRVAALGPSDGVISEYLVRATGKGRESTGPVEVHDVRISSEAGDGIHFASGTTVDVEVELHAHEACPKVAVVLDLLDDSQYNLFNTSTERMGETPVDLQPGEIYRCTFRLDLHLAQGTYYFGAHAYRYDVEHNYDSLVPALTFYVSSGIEVRGAVNCHPRLVSQSREAGSVQL